MTPTQRAERIRRLKQEIATANKNMPLRPEEEHYRALDLDYLEDQLKELEAKDE